MPLSLFPYDAGKMQGNGLGSVQGGVAGCDGTGSKVDGALGKYTGMGNPYMCGGWKKNKKRSSGRRKGEHGSVVSVMKTGTQRGNLAMVVDPDWNGLVKVRMISGEHAYPHPNHIKAYKRSQLRMKRRTSRSKRSRSKRSRSKRSRSKRSRSKRSRSKRSRTKRGRTKRGRMRSRRRQQGGDGQAYSKCSGYGLGSRGIEQSGYGNILDRMPYPSNGTTVHSDQALGGS